MLERLNDLPGDKILQLMEMYRDDPREQKIDLGVGVYKNPEGVTPIMRAIKTAEKRVWDEQTTKSYTGLAGDPAFADAMIDLVLGESVPRGNVAAVATPGGTGACRQAFELGRMANPDVRVFVSSPTWPNHISILTYLDLPVVEYRYFDSESGSVDVSGMLEDLAQAKPGDLVLLHGCCHNPTGANLTATDWRAVIEVLQKTGATPMVDIAYQGFGDGLDADAVGVRMVASEMPELLVAASCSKNFGVYRERAGLLIAICNDPSRQKAIQGNLAYLNRQNYSFPPDHGARLVMTVLTDPELRADWAAELEDMRLNMLGLREQLAEELQRLSGSDRFGFVAQHRGMFSRLGLSPETVDRLREEHGVYMVGDSRINVAGLNRNSVPLLAKAIVEVGA